MSASAIDELRAGFEEPFWALGRDATRDHEAVVVSWPSVPGELVRSAGFTPVFARGGSAPTPAADRVLEPDLFPNRLRQLVEAALTGRLAAAAAVVLPRASDPDYKCFLYLKELVRRRIAPALPPLLLFDLLRLDDAHARAYNAGRARELHGRLAELAAQPPRPAELAEAVALANRARAAARRLDALRNYPPRIGGEDALPLLGAFWQVEPERYVSLANAAHDAIGRRPPIEAPRVLAAGTPVDGSTLHAAIEAEGAVVVTELSPFGRCGTSVDVERSADPFAALVGHYARESIDARLPVDVLLHKLADELRGVDAVVISLPPDDSSFGWDYPRIRELLARRAIPHAVLGGDATVTPTGTDRERIRALLGRARTEREAGCG
jgi:benzoyl-CoA reductase/2-hydroxyglutaryl-CoA dehydratase subunit BcrC/BadD/HgdB